MGVLEGRGRWWGWEEGEEEEEEEEEGGGWCVSELEARAGVGSVKVLMPLASVSVSGRMAP